MRAALAMARRGLGNVWPNPAVGCVLVQPDAAGGRVVGRGWTQPGGRPHAEAEALARAGDAAAGAVAYVSLEPCNHRGRTPACARALAEAGVARVAMALEDPDPRVSGTGAAALRDAGLEVTAGLLEAEAAELNAGYLLRVRDGRPLVTVKVATTLDGRIATHAGDSRWITGEWARAWAHGLRARHDAVMVGVGTALADDPMLTCRLPGLPKRPTIRIVADSRLRLPLTSRLVAGAGETPFWLVTLAGGDHSRKAAYRDCGVEIIEIEAGPEGRPEPAGVFAALAARGLTRVLVEGGGHVIAGLLRAGLVDRLEWFRAGIVIGGDGVPAAAAFGVDRLDQAPAFERVAVRRVGDDTLETYRRRT